MPTRLKDTSAIGGARAPAAVTNDRRRHVDQGSVPVGDPAAQVVVLVEQEYTLVESAKTQEQVAPYQEARPRCERHARIPVRQHERARGIPEIGCEERAGLEEHAAGR